MNIFRKLTMAALSLSVIASVGFTVAPAHAQATGDAFSEASKDSSGGVNVDQATTGAQTQQTGQNVASPQLLVPPTVQSVPKALMPPT